jgi:hypothetical protein
MPRRADPDPAWLPEILTIDEARAAGLTSDQVRQRVRSGCWQAVATGAYLRTPLTTIDEHERIRLSHVARSVGCALRHAGSVIALHSAAACHQLPTVATRPSTVHLISRSGRAGIRGGVQIHRLALEESEVIAPGWTDVRAPITTPLRTWMDMARFGPLTDSLAVGDNGVRRGLFTVEDLVSAAGASAGRGCRLMRVAAQLVDGTRETPLESWSWACFHQWSLPTPQMQAVILDDRGGFIGRVDFLWKKARLIGEADGALKYDDRRANYEEKRREDALRALGYQVIRWGWGDLRRPQDLRRRLEAALLRG